MFLPLVDALRCPKGHEDTWLVASIERAGDRDIVDGVLGCPSCLAEYPIRDGIVYFSENAPRAGFRQPNEDDAYKLAAALDLTDARMVAVLEGSWGGNAPIVRGVSPAQLLLVNPPLGIASGDGISIVVSNSAPVALASADAIAFDAAASVEMIASLIAALKPGGRLLAPASVAIPAGFVELARDDDVWVATPSDTTKTSAPISLKRRR
jgi:uncharacterized protein YbaR (Trm112 family)